MILSTLDEDAGLAWATRGYILGRSGKYADALIATARALEFNSDDDSIMNNAGQLAAWYDNAKIPPKIKDREKRIIAKLKAKFQTSKSYKNAYARIHGVYAACKGGMISFSKSVAREVARHGITLNVVSPGPSDTPLFARFDESGKLAGALERAIPMRRLGQPEDYPGIIAFLISDDARFITGQTVSVSAGLTMHG